MPVSLEKRLKDKEAEVLRAVKTLGPSQAMDLYDVHCMGAFLKWLRQPNRRVDAYTEKNTNFSLSFDGVSLPLIDRVVERVGNKVSKQEAKIQDLLQQLRERDKIIAMYKVNDYERNAGQLLKLLEICEA